MARMILLRSLITAVAFSRSRKLQVLDGLPFKPKALEQSLLFYRAYDKYDLFVPTGRAVTWP